jgi:hypothetical protein
MFHNHNNMWVYCMIGSLHKQQNNERFNNKLTT